MKTQWLKKSVLILSSVVLLINISFSMPIELGSFLATVSLNDVTLKWSTIHEINNWRFHVERKNVNSTKWDEVGLVPGHGTTNEPHDYTFKDLGLSIGSYNYRLKQEDFNGITEYYVLHNPVIITTISINQLGENIPDNFALYQNYPNPFNPATKIKFDVLSSMRGGTINLKLIIYDELGKEVMKLVDQALNAGSYEVEFTGNEFTTGIYFYKLIADEIVIDTKRMLLLK